MRRIRLLLLCALAFSVAGVGTAQTTTCPAIVDQAVAAKNAFCSDMERGTVCYSYPSVDISLVQPLTETLAPGTRIGVSGIEALQTQPFNLFTGEWGLLQMRLQPNPADEATAAFLDAFLFGSTLLRNASGGAARYDALTNVVSLMRPQPSTDDTPVLRLDQGVGLTVIGRNEAGDWVRVLTQSEQAGWVFADLLSIDGDVGALPVFADTDSSLQALAPMEAITLRSETTDAPCAQATYSGVLLQTSGDQPADITINAVSLRISGTAFVQARWGEALTVNMLAGDSLIGFQAESVLAITGTSVTLSLDADGQPTAGPTLQPYDADFLSDLPLSVLEQPVTLAPALTEAELEERLRAGRRPNPGIWRMVAAEAGEGCPALPLAVGTQIVLEVTDEGDLLLDGTLRFEAPEQATDDERAAGGVYIAAEIELPDRIEVLSPTFFVRRTAVLNGDCVLTSEFALAGV